jgi:hypothetical protein
MKQKTYLRKTMHKLQCDKKRKQEFARQLSSDIESALEAGEDWDSIQKRLGTPKDISRDFNENLDDTAVCCKRRKNRALGVGTGMIVVAVLVVLVGILVNRDAIPNTGNTVASTTDSSENTFSDKAAEERSHQMIEQFNDGSYDTILSRCDSTLKKSLTVDALQQSKEIVMSNAGDFQKYEGDSITVGTQNGSSYTTVQTTARYQNQTVTFTISWDTEQKLCGFYLK